MIFLEFWIQPLSSVTSLDLSMKYYYWGYNLRVDFRNTTLPNIKELRITYFTFSHHWQLEWLSNLETLERLILDSCAIVTHAYSRQHLDADGYPTHGTSIPFEEATRLLYLYPPVYLYGIKWSEYFNTFATTLIRLKSLHIVDDRMNPERESHDVSRASLAHKVYPQYLTFIYGD